MGFFDQVGAAFTAAVNAAGADLSKGDALGAVIDIGGGVQNVTAAAVDSAIPGAGVVVNPNLGVIVATAPASLISGGIEAAQGVDVLGGKGVTAGIFNAETSDPHLFSEAVVGGVAAYEGLPGGGQHALHGGLKAFGEIEGSVSSTTVHTSIAPVHDLSLLPASAPVFRAMAPAVAHREFWQYFEKR